MEIPNKLYNYSWDNTRVHIAIQFHSSKVDGKMLCTKDYIAGELGVSVSNLERHMCELEALGFIPCLGEGHPF